MEEKKKAYQRGPAEECGCGVFPRGNDQLRAADDEDVVVAARDRMPPRPSSLSLALTDGGYLNGGCTLGGSPSIKYGRCAI